jgi:hypothetical protein
MRVDYFLDNNKIHNKSKSTSLSNIELNMFGCGGTATPSKIIELHKYILKRMNLHEYLDRVIDFTYYSFKNLT